MNDVARFTAGASELAQVAVAPLSSALTLLQCAPGRTAAKTFQVRVDGSFEKVRDYSAGKWFAASITVAITSIDSLFETLAWAEARTDAIIIRGRAIAAPAADPRGVRRLKVGDSESRAFFEENPEGLHVVALDNDHVTVSADVDVRVDPERAVREVIATLPPEFHDADVVWHLSSSSGLKTPNDARMRLWFLSSEKRTDRELKAYFSSLPNEHQAHDFAPLADPIQAHYISRPTFVGGLDPIPRRIGLIRGSRRYVDIPRVAVAAEAPQSPPDFARFESTSIDERKRLAKAWIDNEPGAKEDERGGRVTFLVAQKLVRGFVLPYEDAFELMIGAWNERCDPPWSERELSHKVESAADTGHAIEWGACLPESREKIDLQRLKELAKAWKGKRAREIVAERGRRLAKILERDLVDPADARRVVRDLAIALATEYPAADPASMAAHFDGALDRTDITLAEVAQMIEDAQRRQEAEASSAFRRGDHPELGDRLLAALRRNGLIVGTEGAIYSYASGVWSPHAEDELTTTVADFAGTPVPKNNKLVPLALKETDIRGAIKLAKAKLSDPDFFKKSVSGVAFSDCFVRVDARGIWPLAHSPDHRARHALAFRCDPRAPRVRLEKFLDELFADANDREERKLALQEFVGAALIGAACDFEMCLLMLGPGGNGKSELMKIIMTLFPRYAALAPQYWSERFQNASLAGAVVNLVDEMPQQNFIESEKFKLIISGKVDMQAERKYKDEFNFRPRAAHIFNCNRLPKTADLTDGFFRRFLILKLTRVFKKDDYLDPLHRVNAADDVITNEGPGIASWALEGALRLLQQGDYTLPESHSEELEKWKLWSNSVAAWKHEKCVVGGPSPASMLYASYTAFCQEGKMPQVSTREFKGRLEELGSPRVERGEGSFYPLTLRSTFLTSWP